MIEYAVDVLVFCGVVWIIYAKVWKGFLEPRMTARQEAIRRQLEESKAAHERLAAAEAEYRQALERARSDAERVREQTREEGRQIIAELRAHAESEYTRITAANAARLEAERQSVVNSLRQEIGAMAAEQTEAIVRTTLEDESRQRGLVDRFLDDLDARGSTTDGDSTAPTPGEDPATAPSGSR